MALLMNVLTALMNVEKGIDGIRAAYDKAPNAIKDMPCIINLPDEGQPKVAFGGNSRHTIMALLLVDLADQVQSQSKVLPFIDAIPDKIDENSSLNGECDSAMVVRYYEYGVHSYGGKDYFGVKFDIDILC